MPTNVTEDNTSFPNTIEVPLGSDSHATLAEYITSIAQRLANRTAWLKNVVNTTLTWFTQQQYDTGQNPDMPFFVSLRTPGDCNVTGTPQPLNPWRRIFRLPTGLTSLTNVAVYWGADGGFAVVSNAYWRPHNQKWRQEDATQPSYGFIVHADSINLVRKAAAAADWDDWDVNGSLAVDAVYADQFRFPSLVARKRQLALGSAFGPLSPIALRTNNNIKFDDTLDATALSKGIKWPVPLLPNNTIGPITVIFSITNAGDTFQWYRRRQLPDHSTTYGAVGSVVSTDGINQAYAVIPEPSGIQDGDEYELCWKLQSSSNPAQVNANVVYALQSAWDQYGPMGGGW